MKSPRGLTCKFPCASLIFESDALSYFCLDFFELVFTMIQTWDQLRSHSVCHSWSVRDLLDPGPIPPLGMACFLAVLSKQIKGVRALKDDGGCFDVFLQAAVAPIGLEEGVMGLKHSACSQMQDTLKATSKRPVIYILVIHSGICSGR